MNNTTVTIVGDTATALALATFLLSQVKPFVEAIPGIGTEGMRHDNLLRGLNFALNLAALIGLAYLQTGAWPGRADLGTLLIAALGGSVGAHIVYTANNQKRKANAAKVKAAKASAIATTSLNTVPPVPTDPAPSPVPVASIQ